MKDIFYKCEEFIDGPSVIRSGDRALAAEVFSCVSPPANAGPLIRSNGQKILQFSSNDYLGLAMHPDVRSAALRAVAQYGIGSPMGSRLMTGTTKYHLELEEQVAAFKRCQAAVTFASGALAMMGALACLAGQDDMLIMDENAHATLQCGARISGARIVCFRHNDMNHLEDILKRFGGSRPLAVVVDGVYSMQGDVAPLPELVELKEHYDARLIVDDAHGTGVFGEGGRGTAAQFGVEDQVDLHAGTFSKAVGTIGGFVAGKRKVVEYIRYNAPTLVFTKAMPVAVAAATMQSLELLERADQRRKTLWKNTKRLHDSLRTQEFEIGNTVSPITPIKFKGTEAIFVAHELRTAYGIWVAPVVYPAVSLGTSILRVIPTASHSDADIEQLTSALRMVRGSFILGSMPVV